MIQMISNDAFGDRRVANNVRYVPGTSGPADVGALHRFPAAGIRFMPITHGPGAVYMAAGSSLASSR